MSRQKEAGVSAQGTTMRHQSEHGAHELVPCSHDFALGGSASRSIWQMEGAQ
jgi:hypothetical protein